MSIYIYSIRAEPWPFAVYFRKLITINLYLELRITGKYWTTRSEYGNAEEPEFDWENNEKVKKTAIKYIKGKRFHSDGKNVVTM